jgi:C-3',4' desaturase CrtD
MCVHIPMKSSSTVYDVIVVGAGMGGLTTAALLSNDGLRVLLLEAAHVSGGCSSSFYRKGYVFESGATTLTGFDEHQPMRALESMTGIKIPRERIDPGMTVWMDGRPIIKYEDRSKWIDEAIRVFGEPQAQRKFWQRALDVSDIVWKAAHNNPFFPPKNMSDWLKLSINNNPIDARILPYAYKSTKEMIDDCGIANPDFERFVDEQLLITAQSFASDTPFLFAAPALCYTNYSNYYVPGGLHEMAKAVEEFIESKGGVVRMHRKVLQIREIDTGWFEVSTSKGEFFRAHQVVSNIPVWNMSELTEGWVKHEFDRLSERYDKAWGAFTMNVATTDTYPEDLTLHHQIHVDLPEGLPHTGSRSIFVSLSKRGDTKRAPDAQRAMNVSCHADPDYWFSLNWDYEQAREHVQSAILDQMRRQLPGFADSELIVSFPATPVTWEKWIHRSKGRVGGLPQSMDRSILDWPDSSTHVPGLWMCGDTVYPGQGIPGVTLSGINVYYRIKQYLSRQRRISFV